MVKVALNADAGPVLRDDELVAICGALTYAEIGSRMPVIGGYYKVFSYAYHPSIAFAINCIILVSNAASGAAVALVGSEYITGVILPLSLPGVATGCLLVFIPAVGEFVIPDLLGGTGTLMIGKTLWDEFFHNRDWPMASTVAIILLLVLVVPIVLFQNSQARVREANR